MFSKDWEKIYRDKKQINHWPWDNLISYFNNYFKNKKKIKVLELGFGTGGNAYFFIKNKINYTGFEGSLNAVKIVKNKFSDHKKNFIHCDFTKTFPSNSKYDLIFDRGSITHNTDEDVINTVGMIKKSLKKNGLFFGIDWFSTKHYQSKHGIKINKKDNSRIYKFGRLKKVGLVNFFTKKKIEFIFNKFNIIQIEEKRRTVYKKKNKIIKHYLFNIIAKND